MRTKHPEKKYTAIRNYQPLKRIHRALKKSFMESVNQGRETDKDQGLVLAGPDRRDWLQVCIQKGHFKMGGKKGEIKLAVYKKARELFYQACPKQRFMIIQFFVSWNFELHLRNSYHHFNYQNFQDTILT